MSETIEHDCGLVAVVDTRGNRNVLPDGLRMGECLEHRGQLAWGRGGIDAAGDMWVRHTQGRISQGVEEALRTDPISSSVIVHTRYGTSKGTNKNLIHPVLADIITNGHAIQENPVEQIAFAFNGNVVDLRMMNSNLNNRGIAVAEQWDTEILSKYLAARIADMQGDVSGAIYSLGAIDGAINGGIVMPDGNVYAFRDMHGIRPLSVGEWDGKVAIASEGRAIHKVWGQSAKVRDVKPGEVIHLNAKQIDQGHELWDAKPRHCAFEWIYFSNWLSTLDGASVQGARYMWGEILAERDADHLPKETLVVPVPNSARVAAQGYANKSQRRYVDLLLASGGRAFIETQEDRQKKTDQKYSIDPHLVRGKPIVLVDDSIVRGETMQSLIHRIREEAGPSEIHLRITSPAILNPCYYGVDMKTMKELIARRFLHGDVPPDGLLPQYCLDGIARELKVDSLRYISISDVPKVLGIAYRNLCMACMTGEYPTKGGQELYHIARGALSNGE